REGNFEMALRLSSRARGNLQKALHLLARASSAPFGDVRRNRYRRAAELRGDDAAIRTRKLSSHPVHHDYDVARSMPHLELSEIVHGKKVRLLPTRDAPLS